MQSREMISSTSITALRWNFHARIAILRRRESRCLPSPMRWNGLVSMRRSRLKKAKNCVTNAILRRMRAEGSVYPVRIAWHALWNMQDTMTRRSLLIRSCWNSIVIFRTGSHRTTMCGEFEKRLLHGSMRFTRRRSFVRQRI